MARKFASIPQPENTKRREQSPRRFAVPVREAKTRQFALAFAPFRCDECNGNEMCPDKDGQPTHEYHCSYWTRHPEETPF